MDFKFSKPIFLSRRAVERGLGKPVVQRDFDGLPAKPLEQRSYPTVAPQERPSLLAESTKDTTYVMLKVTELSDTVVKLKAQIDEEMGRGRGRDAQVESFMKHATKMQLWCNEQKSAEARQGGTFNVVSTSEAQQALDRVISDQEGLQGRLLRLEESVNAKGARIFSKIDSLDVLVRSHEQWEDKFVQAETRMRRLLDDYKSSERAISLLQEQSKQLVNRIRLSSVTDQMAALRMFNMSPDTRLEIMNKLAPTMDRYVGTLQAAVEKKGIDGSILCGMKATAWQADVMCDADASASASQATRMSPSSLPNRAASAEKSRRPQRQDR